MLGVADTKGGFEIQEMFHDLGIFWCDRTGS
jgi:hypothetical protein